MLVLRNMPDTSYNVASPDIHNELTSENEKVLSTLYSSEFSQAGVKDKLKRIEVNSSGIYGVKDTDERIQFHRNLSSLPNFSLMNSQDYFKNHSIKVSQFKEGEYILIATVRGLGAGCWFNCSHTANGMKSAAASGFSKTLKEYLDNGWDPTMALIEAARCGQKECVKILLDAGADIDHQIPSNSGDYIPGVWGYTPLMSATFSFKADIVELLIQRGASTTIKCAGNLDALDLAHGRQKYLNNNPNPESQKALDKIIDLLTPENPEKAKEISIKISQRAIAHTRQASLLTKNEEETFAKYLFNTLVNSPYIKFIAKTNVDTILLDEEISKKLSQEIAMYKNDHPNVIHNAFDLAIRRICEEQKIKNPPKMTTISHAGNTNTSSKNSLESTIAKEIGMELGKEVLKKILGF